jgi:hypothetical protein
MLCYASEAHGLPAMGYFKNTFCANAFVFQLGKLASNA